MNGVIFLPVLVACLAGEPKVHVSWADSMTRISPYSVTKTNPYPAKIRAARMERESFQVLVGSPTNSTYRVSMSITGPSALPATAFTIEQVGYVYVSNATDPLRVYPFDCPTSVLQRGGCWIPDPLFPLDGVDTQFRM